jgi:hypothetical protein
VPFREWSDDLARLLAKQLRPEAHCLLLELVPAPLDQTSQLADHSLVLQPIAPLPHPLFEDGEIVLLSDEIRECSRLAQAASYG